MPGYTVQEIRDYQYHTQPAFLRVLLLSCGTYYFVPPPRFTLNILSLTAAVSCRHCRRPLSIIDDDVLHNNTN